MANELYNLKLHSYARLNNGMAIMRVPGGWIYDCWDDKKNETKVGTFVPYNEEFMEITPDIAPFQIVDRHD